MSRTVRGSVAARRRKRVPESTGAELHSSDGQLPRAGRCLARTIDQLRHAADLAEACRGTSITRGAGHVIAILDDLERELRVLRSVAS